VVAQSTIRGPLLGLGAGALAFALLASGPGRVALMGALGFVVLAIGLAVSTTGSAGLETLARFARVAASGDSSWERLVVWRDALSLPLADPARAVFGFGPEMQAAAFERAEATVRLTQNAQWDRAHNLVLDAWLTGGLLGVAGLLVLLGVTLVSLARSRESLLGAAVVGALLGHLVEVSFAFHTVVTGTLFWVLLALAASLAPRATLGSVGRAPPLALIALLLVPVLAAPAIGDAIYGEGRRMSQRGDARAAAQTNELASAWLPWLEEPVRAAGLAWQQVASRQGDAEAAARAEADLLEAARRAPWEPTPHLRLVRLYLARGQGEHAEAACQAALAAGPYRASVWDGCADVSAQRGITDQARERRARAELMRQPLS
jgi:hypothetical protein